ncbi:LuxR C-terminal-related transcriptional regulator [Paenibacillus puerhi]|uniref:LuxR C-terminal-related transcriptional regulator n=1 Tax=Paenibacillus puerhi TaxID=2692622 RepID=UPI00135A1C71|nr:LuxR C-terminal-related transcriptional regulator [Paenibacillus puerhi]
MISTKLCIPPPRPNVVYRSRLVERLNEGMQQCKLTLVSAPPGYGKTTLVSEWLAGCSRPAAWLSLDEGDNDPATFLTYLFTALQTVAPNTGKGAAGMLQSPQPPPLEALLTALLHEITAIPDPFVLVLDDHHLIKSEAIDQAIALLLEWMPPQMHLVIATREEPRLPLARLRVRNQLCEVRASDLRFSSAETAEFLGRVMGLSLSSENILLLEARTEGWIAGLQLAALSLQRHLDPDSFIQSFTGSHRFVLDYLVEEVLKQQPASIQTYLLRTSILDRLCGSLCDAVLGGEDEERPFVSGQDTLDYLEQANLFIVPLDHERRWYRYHHLFADLLRHRLQRIAASALEDEHRTVDLLHIRASEWYESHGLDREAFYHAAAARDLDRAARLVEGKGMPLIFRGAVTPVLNWLDSMPSHELDARPMLGVMYASGLLMTGRLGEVEPKLQAVDKSLQGTEHEERTRDLLGHVASIRAMLAVSRHQTEAIIAESTRALDLLHPDNLPVRTAAAWTLGYARQLQGDYAAAGKAYTEALAISRKIGHTIITIMASLGLAHIQKAENQLQLAADTYLDVLRLAGDPQLPIACEAHLGLAQIYYEWNDLDSARQHGRRSVELAKQIEPTDRVVAGEVLLARLKLSEGEVSAAAARLAEADHVARQHHYVNQLPPIAEARVLTLLRQDNLDAAAKLAQKHELPLSQARVYLAQGNAPGALALLESLPRQAEAEAEDLKADQLGELVLRAVARHANGETSEAVQLLADALARAEPGGFIRLFVDEGLLMYSLLGEAAACGIMPEYVGKLLAVCEAEMRVAQPNLLRPQPSKALIEPLSIRELEVLRLIAQGLSNREISERLFLALSTVKGHNGLIFEKLQVSRRTEAVARARELGLL